MNLPKISIVTPVFNQVHYLEETICSVLSQNYPNLEYIIIDGGSTDGSVEVIKKHAPRLAYWESEKDRGMYHAIKKGFDRSTGDLLAWINSDDLYHRKSFFTVAELFSTFPMVNWIQGVQAGFDTKGRTVSVNKGRPWSRYNFYLGDYKWIQQESTFWRRSLWEKAGADFNNELRYAGDFDLWLKFFRHEKLYVTDALIGGFRKSGTAQLSVKNAEAYHQEILQCLSKEPMDQETRRRIAWIKRVNLYRSLLKRIKWDPLKDLYLKLFEYPPGISFNFETQQFEMIQFPEGNL